MPDYSKCIIYKITCNDTSITECYVGSTCNFTRRKSQHKHKCNNVNTTGYNIPLYKFIRDNGGWDNFTMSPIKKFPCSDKMEKLIEELNIVSEVSDQESKNSDTLETLSQTVGLVPNVNKNDNIIQGGVVGGGALLTTIITYAMTGDTTQALIASLGVLIVLGLFSGLILMVVGWVRTMRKVKK